MSGLEVQLAGVSPTAEPAPITACDDDVRATPMAGMSQGALDRLMPMHLLVGPDGTVRHAGPTLARISPEPLAGKPLSCLLHFLRPRAVETLETLRGPAGGHLRLRLKTAPDVPIKGISVPLEDGGVLINLSFGYAVKAAVDQFDLTCGDFAITDLTIELLYLIEAKSAAQEEQRKLNQRLNGAKQRAEAEALSDGLTGLANRRAFDAFLSRSLDHDAPFAVMVIDLDYFKLVNDTLGHAAGDLVLKRVADVLQAQTRASDHVARIGGDEFSILFPRLTDAAKLRDVARRIIAGLEVPVPFGDRFCRISGSIGIALNDPPAPEAGAQDIMRAADTATYASKLRGRGQATLYDPSLDAEVAQGAAMAKANGTR